MDEDDIPFKGATTLKYKRDRKKAKKRMERDGIVCTCGALKHVFTTLYYLHDDDCIINKNRKD